MSYDFNFVREVAGYNLWASLFRESEICQGAPMVDWKSPKLLT